MPTAEKVLLALSYWLLAKSKTNNKSKSHLAANAREQHEFTFTQLPNYSLTQFHGQQPNRKS